MNERISFRDATPEDLPTLIALLMDDKLGQAREDAGNMSAYQRALDAIVSNPDHLILVMEEDGAIVGCAEISYLPTLSFQGAWRAQLEGIRIRLDKRGRGLGKLLIGEAVSRAKTRNCGIVQLTTNRLRAEAIAFYEQQGFRETHAGMKMYLS